MSKLNIEKSRELFQSMNILPVGATDLGIPFETTVTSKITNTFDLVDNIGPVGNSGHSGVTGTPRYTNLSSDELLDALLLLIDAEIITAKKAMNIRSMLRSSDNETVTVAETLLKKLRIDNLK